MKNSGHSSAPQSTAIVGKAMPGRQRCEVMVYATTILRGRGAMSGLAGRSTLQGAFAIRYDLGVVSYSGRIICMPRGNPSPKLAITIDPDIHQNVLAAAARDGLSVSAWMTAAAREALQRRAGLAAVALWERQHGRFTAEEMNEARRNVRAQLRTSRTVRRSA